MILVSACLMGDKCKYNGGDNYNQKVIDFLKGKEYLEFCPELMGGLSAPRPPAEIRGGNSLDVLNNKARVLNNTGEDNTKAFIKGAEAALKLAKENNAELIILKERSPSCGVNIIYDGSFKHKIIPGSGVTAGLLKENGFKTLSEEDL